MKKRFTGIEFLALTATLKMITHMI